MNETYRIITDPFGSLDEGECQTVCFHGRPVDVGLKSGHVDSLWRGTLLEVQRGGMRG